MLRLIRRRDDGAGGKAQMKSHAVEHAQLFRRKLRSGKQGETCPSQIPPKETQIGTHSAKDITCAVRILVFWLVLGSKRTRT